MNLNVNRLYYTTGWNNIDVRDIDSWRIPQVGPSYYIIMIILGVGHTCQVVCGLPLIYICTEHHLEGREACNSR